MSGMPHDPEVAEWMGLDTAVEAAILESDQSDQSDRPPVPLAS